MRNSNEFISIMLPQWGCHNYIASSNAEQWGYSDVTALISQDKDVNDATPEKCPYFVRHFTLSVPHLPTLVPQACLSCLRQLETLPAPCTCCSLTHVAPILATPCCSPNRSSCTWPFIKGLFFLLNSCYKMPGWLFPAPIFFLAWVTFLAFLMSDIFSSVADSLSRHTSVLPVWSLSVLANNWFGQSIWYDNFCQTNIIDDMIW